MLIHAFLAMESSTMPSTTLSTIPAESEVPSECNNNNHLGLVTEFLWRMQFTLITAYNYKEFEVMVSEPMLMYSGVGLP